jgi:trehalose 6-phosphate synthase/phosphatase
VAAHELSVEEATTGKGATPPPPFTSPFIGEGGGAGSPKNRMLREHHDIFASLSPDVTDTAAFASAGVFAPDGLQSPGSEPLANMADSAWNAARPPLSEHRSGFRRLGLRGGMKQRLLVVANRLPVSANRRGEDQWSLKISDGGLVSALLGNSEIYPSSHAYVVRALHQLTATGLLFIREIAQA